MFNKIIAYCLKNRRFVLLFSLLLLVGGFYMAANSNVDVLPDLNRPVVTVLIEAPGFAPREIETLVIIPMEAALNGAPGVRRVRSVSKRSIGKLTVEFDWGSDVYRNRQVVSEKILHVKNELPKQVRPLLGSISSIMGEITLIGIQYKKSKNDLRKIRTFADWNIKKRLLSIPGISGVTVMGGEVKEYQILIKPKKIKKMKLTIDTVSEWLSNFGKNTSGGFIERNGEEIAIRNLGTVYDPEEIKGTVVGYRAGRPVKLGQIADVKVGHKAKRGSAGINGKEGIILAVQKQPKASSLKLTKKIKNILAQINKEMNGNLQIDILFKQATFIQLAIDNVVEAMRDGAIIILLILLLFFWSIRTTIITMIALPLSLVSTLIILQLFNYSINTMTLGGLVVVIGLLVDDAIVYTENAFRRLRENRDIRKIDMIIEVVFKASGEIRNVIILSTLVVVLVFIPLLFLGGVEGRLFRPLGLSFIIALTASTVVAVTVTPVLCFYLLPKVTQKMEKESVVVRLIKKLQLKNLKFILNKPLVPAVPMIILLGITVFLGLRIGKDFLPPFNEGSLTLEVITPAGTSLSKSAKIAGEVESMVLSTKGVITVCRRTGRSEMDEHAEGVNYSEFDVILNREKTGKLKEQVIKELRKKFTKLKNVAVNIGQPISHRLDHLMSGIKAQIAIFLYGPSLETLHYKASQVYSIVKGIPGTADILVETESFSKELKIAVDHEKISEFGLHLGKLMKNLEIALNGQVVGKIEEKQKIFNITLQFDNGLKKSMEQLNNFVVKYLNNGKVITLGMVAEIYESKGPSEIKRDNGSRRIAVQLNTNNRDLGSVVEDIKKQLDAKLKLADGYYYTIGGRYKTQQKATFNIIVFSALALLMIVFILHRTFENWVYTLLVMFNIPLSFIGGVLALYFSGVNLSIASIVGFIALAGIASRNDIMMINHFMYMMREEKQVFSKEMVIEGALNRLIPVLMTAITAILALLPVIVSGGNAPGKEILFPVAIVIAGGLLSSTFINVFLTPVLFYQAGKRQNKGMF